MVVTATTVEMTGCVQLEGPALRFSGCSQVTSPLLVTSLLLVKSLLQ